MRLIRDNTDYSEYAEGLDDFVLTIQRNSEDYSTEYGTSLDIQATGSLYDLIYNTFFVNVCEGFKKKLYFTVIDDGCGIEIPMVIVPELIDICFDGCADVVLRYEQTDDDKYLCLKNQLSFWSNDKFYDFMRTRSKKIIYCQDYSFITWALYTIYFLTIKILVDALQGLCTILRPLGGDDFCDTIDGLEDFIVGCNKFYTGVLLKDIFQFNAELCGLQFQSQLLNDVIYSKACLVTAVGGEGANIQGCDVVANQFNTNNAPVRNILQVMAELTPVFNSDFRIHKGVLRFDRKDRFYENNEFLVNIDTASTDECPRYALDTDLLKAYWQLNFTSDGQDPQGNKNINQYNETVEWNKEGNPNQKGKYELYANFAPAKFSHDENSRTSDEQQLLNGIREGGSSSRCNFTHAMIVQDGQLQVNKLVIIDDKEFITCAPCKFSTVQKERIGFAQYIGFKNLIRPVWTYNKSLKGQALYDNFHYIDDPNGEGRIIKVDTIKYYPESFCDDVNLILENGLLVRIDSVYGQTIPEKIDINFAECSITLYDLRFKCRIGG